MFGWNWKFFEGNSSYFSVRKSALKTREFFRPNFAKVPFPIQHFLQTYPPPISQSYWPGSYFLTEEKSSFLFNLPDSFRILEKYQELRLCLIKYLLLNPYDSVDICMFLSTKQSLRLWEKPRTNLFKSKLELMPYSSPKSGFHEQECSYAPRKV